MRVRSIVQLQHWPHVSPNGSGETAAPTTDASKTTTDGKTGLTMALVTDIRSDDTGFAHLVATLRDTIARRKVYRQTLRELKSLSGRELEDLGMHRSMITRIATEAAYGK